MLALLNALKRKIATDNQLTAAYVGGVWRDCAPPGQAMPYLIIHADAADSDVFYGEGSYSPVNVRLVTVGIGHDAAGAIAEMLDLKIKSSILALAGGQTNFDVRRLSEPTGVRQDSPSIGGQEVWNWFSSYLYTVAQ